MPRSNEPFADRVAPWSPEGEISVLGGMLIDSDAVAKAVDLVDDYAFYREANRRLFRAMQRLFERGEVIDPVTLTEELRGRGELESVGGTAYLAELMEAVPTAANIEYHCRIIKERALLRRLIEAATESIQEAYGAGSDQVEEVIDRAEQRIFQLSQAGERKGFVWIKELLWPAFEHIERLQEAKGSIIGVPSGYPRLDYLTAGFQRAELIVVAGRPSMGKTALVLNFMQHAAIEKGTAVALFSLEMSGEAIVQRLLCSEGRVNSSNLRRGTLSEQEYMQLATAAGHLNTAPIWIDDSPALSALDLRAKARRLRAETELGLIIVDYMQLMRGPAGAENRVQEISSISRSLKAVAKELDVPVIALSQLSRAPEQRGEHRPQLSDLRESGAIEQDADLVLFLYRPEVYFGDEDKDGNSLLGKAELIIGKQRNGPTGTVHLRFEKEFTRFYELDTQHESEVG